jgi:hypothetical protein
MKLRVFIGSSSESLNVANAIQHGLGSDIECVVWPDSFFKLSSSTINDLVAGVDKFDAGIFVFGDDDKVSSRGMDFSAPRDNVIFEHGLFCGRLGPQRTFVVRPKSRTLKWLSDLDGFTPAKYDEVLAKSNADKAVEEACEQILREMRRMAPRPGIFVHGEWRHLGDEFWTYRAAEPSSIVADEEGIQLFSEHDIGITFPHHDNLDAKGRYCVVRLRVTPSTRARFYVSPRAGGDRILLSLADSHTNEGWGTPDNEFMLRLPHLKGDQYESLVIDLEALEPYIGPVLAVNGLRVRPGMKITHFGVCDDLPVWLKDAPVLNAARAPLITIDHPANEAVVEREEVIHGTFDNVSNANAIRVFVFTRDNSWYLQPQPSIENGRWQAKAFFGRPDSGAGTEFRIAALVTAGQQVESSTKNLPAALGRSIIRVTRKK